MSKKLKILFISSLSPFSSSNFGLDIINSLEEKGHNVDFITKYKDDRFTSTMYSVLSENMPMSFVQKLKTNFPFFAKINRPHFINNKFKFSIVSKDESNPAIDSSLILDKVKSEYDFILINFWQGFITSKSLFEIYRKLNIPILIFAADMFPLTGGCNYFWECRNFLNNCGTCPAISSKDRLDFTSNNFNLKKYYYSNINCSFLGNTWMNSFAKQSPLFENKLIEKIFSVVNEKVYKPREKEILKDKFNIDSKKTFVIFAGASTIKNVRKGYKYLVHAVNQFQKNLQDNQKQNVLLLLAGTPQLNIESVFNIEVMQLGVLDYKTLAEAYAVSDVFLSTSIEDAGPSMINQSIMCGTPVIAFNIGVAIDLVISKKTGYCAKHENLDDLVYGLNYIYNLNDMEKKTMANECRNLALSEFSYRAFAANIENSYLNALCHYKDL
jgi:glycosyltransferase involved in cell wall biosynthesis